MYQSDRYPDFENPNDCPVCHTKVNPHRVGWIELRGSPSQLEVVFNCNSEKCNSFFITYYKKDFSHKWVENTSEPNRYNEIEFDQEIKDTSQKFIDIYNQAMRAKSLGLNEIAGIGLRKSLEFLVKDYTIQFLKEDEETIKKMQLGNVIDKKIDDIDVKEMAKRATWIGNDETHYNRTWEDKDIEDLIILIDICVSSMYKHIKAQNYLDTMPAT